MRYVGKKKTTQRFISGFLTAVFVALAVGASSNPCVAQPSKVSYQGQLKKNLVRFNGTANFKFAMVAAGQTLWSNDGTSVAGSEPTASVAVDVDNGVFGVLLGEPPMVPLAADQLGPAPGQQDRPGPSLRRHV